MWLCWLGFIRKFFFTSQKMTNCISNFGVCLKSTRYISICLKPRVPEKPLRPLHPRDWEPMTITLQALSLVQKAEPVQVRFKLRLRDQWSMWMQDGCTVYMDSYMRSNGSYFMVAWTIFNNHLLEVGLTPNWETMAIQTIQNCKDPHE
jgi:hypothetical protein